MLVQGKKRLVFILSGLLWMATTVWATDMPAESGQPPLNHVPSANCGECHQEIYQQWQNSMHAKSTALTDPIHGGVYRMEVGDPTQEGILHKTTNTFPVCLQCHAPIAARDKTTKLDAKPMYSEGVNCVACHTMTNFKGVQDSGGKLRLGAAAYTYSANNLQGPEGTFNNNEPVLSPGGDTEPKVNSFSHQANSALFKSSEVCLGCHQLMVNPQKVPVCAIGDQFIAKDGSSPTCQSCHMPVVNGFANHEISGGHNVEQVRKAVILTLLAKPKGKRIHTVVTLKNTLLHTMPSGAPFRNMVLKVSAFNNKNEEIWSNFQENPDKEDPQAFMMLKLVNNEGNPVMPPLATKIGNDTRLKPHEKRILIYPIPSTGVKKIQVQLFYNLITKPMMEKMVDTLPDELKTPALVGRAEVIL